jgi:hypothetical protein
VADLLREVNREQSAIIQRQVALAERIPRPTPTEWVAAAVDAANGMLATERGCLLVRVWAEIDADDPESVERFIASDHPLAMTWRRSATATFPDLPPVVVIARNVIVLRTLQWITVRRAGRILRSARP